MADRYWVGGSGLWGIINPGTNWATTDGGTGGQATPTIADNVFFTAKPAPTWQANTAYTAGTSTRVSTVAGNGYFYECTTSGTTGASEPTWPTTAGNTVADGTAVWTCRLASMTLFNGTDLSAKSINCTGYIGTFTGTPNTLTVAGSITLSSAMTCTINTSLTITATSTITCAGKTLNFDNITTFNSAAGTLSLADAFTAGAFTLTAGTFTTNSYNVTLRDFISSNFNTRAINLGASVVTLSSSTPLSFTVGSSSLTLDAGTSSIVITSDALPVTFGGGGKTFYDVSSTSTITTRFEISGANTFNNLSFTALSTTTPKLVHFYANQTINGSLSTSSTAGNRRVYFQGVSSNTVAAARTLIINGTTSLTDADFRDITVSGTAAPISGTRIGNQGSNSGITFSSAKTVYWNLAAGGNWVDNAWAATSGAGVSTDNFPLPQDTATIENTGLNTSTTITLPSPSGLIVSSRVLAVSSISLSTRTNAMTLATNGANLFGNLTLGSGVTQSGTGAITFVGRGTQTITSAGKTLACPITVDSTGGTVTLGDALNIGTTNAITVTNGTFTTSASNYNLTAGSLSSNNSNTRTISFNGSTITLGAATPWVTTTTTNLTFNRGTSTIVCNSINNPNFNGAGLTFYNISFPQTSSVTCTINDSNTFNNFSVTANSTTGAGPTKTILFGADQTIGGSLSTSSTAGNRRVYFQSSTLGTTRTLTVNATPSLTDADFSNITVSGTAAPISGTRIGDQGGNSGITFTTAKTVYVNIGTSANWNDNIWALSSGGGVSTDNFPLPQDTAIIQNTGFPTSGSLNLTQTGHSMALCAIDMSARTNAMTVTVSSLYSALCYGDLIFGSGVSITNSASFVFLGQKTQTVTTAGKSLGDTELRSPAGTLVLADNYTSSSALFTLTSGTLNLNVDKILSIGTFSSDNSNTRSINFGTSGKIQIPSTGTSTYWSAATTTNLSYTGTVSPIELTGAASSGTRTITHGSTAGSETSAVSFSITAGSGTGIITFTASSRVKSVDFTGFSGTLSNTAFTIYGSLLVSTGMTLTAGTNAITFAATSGTQDITSNAKTFDFPVTVNAPGATVRLQDNLTVGSTRIFTLSAGTLDLNTNKILVTGSFYSDGSSNRVISFGTSGKIQLSSAATATVFYAPTATNLSYTGTVSAFELTGASTGTRSITYGSVAGVSETYAPSFSVDAGGGTIQASGSFKNLNFPATFAGLYSSGSNVTIYGNLTLSSSMTMNSNTPLTFAATSGTQNINTNGKAFVSAVTVNAPGAAVKLQSNISGPSSTAGSPFTLTAGTLDLNDLTLAWGYFNSSGSSVRSIAFGTSGKIQAQGSGATSVNWTAWICDTLTNFSYTGTPLVELTSTSNSKYINHGGTAGGTEANALSFSFTTSSSGAGLGGSHIKNLNFTGFSGTLASSIAVIYGNLTISTGMSLSAGTNLITFAATSGTQDITSNGKTFDFPVTINGVGTTVRLLDALTIGSTRTFTLTNGTFNANNFNVTTGLFSSNNSNTRTITMGSGTWTLSGTGTVWDLATTTNLTFNKDTANITLSNTSTSARTFAGGGLTYNNLTIGGTTGTSTLTFTESNTFATLASTKTVAHTITFTAGTTTTVSGWTIAGTPGNIVTLGSSTTSAFTLAKSGGGRIQMPYMSISYATGSTTDTWYAPISTDGGNNTNIIFAGIALYWIGGSGTWDNSNTANWSESSGGSASTLYPNGGDVYFDVNSDSGSPFTVTIGATVNCGGLTVSGLDQTMTLAGSSALGVGGSLSFPATSFSNSYTGAVTFGSPTSSTITSNGNSFTSDITFNGVGGTWALQDNLTTGTANTTTLTNGTLDLNNKTLTTGLFSSSNSNTRLIAFGTGKISVTGNNATVWSCSTLTNFSYTGTPTVEFTYSGATGTRTYANGVSGGTETNVVSIYVTAGSDTFTATNSSKIKTLNYTGFTGTGGTPVLGIIYGDLVMGSGMTMATQASTTTFGATSGIQKITSNGVTIPRSLTINGVGGTVRLEDALTVTTYALTLTNGTFDANNYNVTLFSLASSNSNTRTITMGSGSWTLSGTGTVWNLATTTNLTFNKDTANITLSDTSTTSRTFAGGGLTYNNLTIGGTTGISTLTFTGSNTFATLASTKTVAHTILFTAGTTTTVSGWTIKGTSGNVVTVGSATAASHTLSKIGGVVTGLDYLSISRSTATPSNIWYAGANSTDGGNNTGWIFTEAPPSSLGNFFIMMGF